MRWPDLFFKSRKSNPVPEIVTVPPRTVTTAETAKAEDEKGEAIKAETVNAEKEKVDSLRALTESGSVRLTPRAVKESPIAAVTTEKPAETSTSNAKTAVLPAAVRPGGVSLRQRAKLTEDARNLPKKDVLPSVSTPEVSPTSPGPDAPSVKPAESSKPEESSGSAEAPPVPAAVVPAAFPVPVETGSVMDGDKEKIVGFPPPAESEASRPAAPEPAPNKPAAGEPAAKIEPPAPTPRDTARVHIAHTTTSANSTDTAIEPVKPDTREKQEFILANGERIYGHVLSETPQTIYLDHPTLGVLTLPRAQIAAKPIEVILINGDRVVGDLIAETPECLYVKHASLGMLTIPHGQRSTRVVEAILKDGDRILGEVLAETDNFTVIRSATLGTVAVQHEQVAMLNRKIEQMQLRALPAPAPALDDKARD